MGASRKRLMDDDYTQDDLEIILMLLDKLEQDTLSRWSEDSNVGKALERIRDLRHKTVRKWDEKESEQR